MRISDLEIKITNMSYDFSYCCSINDQLINMQNKLRMNGSFQEPINSHATSETLKSTNDGSQAVTELNSQTHTWTNEGSQAETELNSQTHTTNDCSQAKSYDELLTKLDSISFTSQDSIKRTACWIVKIYINNAREYCNYWKKMFLQGEVLNKHILTIY